MSYLIRNSPKSHYFTWWWLTCTNTGWSPILGSLFVPEARWREPVDSSTKLRQPNPGMIIPHVGFHAPWQFHEHKFHDWPTVLGYVTLGSRSWVLMPKTACCSLGNTSFSLHCKCKAMKLTFRHFHVLLKLDHSHSRGFAFKKGHEWPLWQEWLFASCCWLLSWWVWLLSAFRLAVALYYLHQNKNLHNSINCTNQRNRL